MAYYDRIAKQWQNTTGYKGGAFKELILNDLLLDKIPGIGGRAILELGVGNGYFMSLLLHRFSGQQYARVVLTDQSSKLLKTARDRFNVPNAEYQVLDVGDPFPFENDGYDLIIASFIFNEVRNKSLKNAVNECFRVLTDGGHFLMTVTHPDFVDSLNRRGQIKKTSGGFLTMPGAGNLRLPVVPRGREAYGKILTDSGFRFEEEDVFPNDKVLNIKPGLRQAGGVPLALLFTCMK